MDSKEKDRDGRQASRRRFLKRGAMLAGFAAAGGLRPASAQQQALGSGVSGLPGYARVRPGWVEEDDVPKEAILKDPWTGEPLRDPEGNVLVDWTGTPQWREYNRRLRAMGGPLLGTREKDWRGYGYRSRYVTTYRYGHQAGPTTIATPPPAVYSPVEAQLGIITPSALHFVNQHALDPVDIDPRKWTIYIYGMVDRPKKISLEDLMTRLPSVSRIHFVECNSDGAPGPARLAPWAHAGHIFGESSTSEWTGVLLSTLLEMVGVRKGAKWLWVGTHQPWDSVADFTSVPLAKGWEDAMLAYGQNGEPVRPENGYPIRLLVPGYEGARNIKRVARIKVMDEPGLYVRETSGGYTDARSDQRVRWYRFEHGTRSIIVNPSGGQQLKGRGFYEIRGLAWSGGGKVTRVEVTTDGGRTWKDARLQEPILPKAYTRFVFPWSWNGEEVTIASRSTDERGGTQPTVSQWAKAAGHTVEDLKKQPAPRSLWRFNPIQPWTIDRGGKVTNAILTANAAILT